MLHSQACNLYGMSQERLASIGECIYDQGGYFPEGTNGLAQSLKLCMYAHPSKSQVGVGVGREAQVKNKYCIWAALPQISEGVPICVVFRALGCIEDRSILEHICYVRTSLCGEA